MRTGYAPVNGLQLYYEIHGEDARRGQCNTPLVLIHGGGSTIESTFGMLLPALSAQMIPGSERRPCDRRALQRSKGQPAASP